MNYKISYINTIDVVHVIYFGSLSLNERKQAVNDVCNTYIDKQPLKILVDVCDLIMDLTLKEQQEFGNYIAFHDGLSQAKVAVVHEPDYNPNLLIDTCAFNNGYRIAEFNQVNEAKTWLTEA